MNIVNKIDHQVKIKYVLVSVSDKSNLNVFIPQLIGINPEINIISTGGTYSHIKEILGNNASSNLSKVSDYTGQQETQGGLVKTLDFKIYLGLLTETYNTSHTEDLKRTGAFPIDMVIVNLYPFEETVAKKNVTVEQARGNIDIGGPCMIRSAAKNFLRVASVVDPSDYESIIDQMKAEGGALNLDSRFRLAQKAFEHIATYDRAIADFLSSQPIENVTNCYNRS
jgi:phosphoribosylaminoimidazolecarboxamide formyltransferase/IMP cyclohydrolase